MIFVQNTSQNGPDLNVTHKMFRKKYRRESCPSKIKERTRSITIQKKGWETLSCSVCLVGSRAQIQSSALKNKKISEKKFTLSRTLLRAWKDKTTDSEKMLETSDWTKDKHLE
jgi:hypothetical protein